MGRIIGYQYDNDIKDDDAWIGTEATSRRTKQYTAQAVADYLNINGSISIVGQMSYKYSTTPLNGIGTFAVFGGGPNIVAFSAITKLTLSNQDISEQRVVEYLNLLVGSDMLISESEQISTFGYYSIDSYAVNATNSDYYDLSVTFKSGNGSMEAGKVYETQNFTLAAEENISTLQTTIDAGNTYQETASSPLWTWGSVALQMDGSSAINGYEGIFSGKYVRLKSNDFPNYTTLANGSLVIPLPGAADTRFRLTANPLIEEGEEVGILSPATSGTLALTTDIIDSPWDTVLGGINYAGGNVGIGTTGPLAKLHVFGGSAIIGDDDFNAVKISANGSGTTYNTIGNGFIAPNVNFNINNQTKLTINGTTGNVGIGTTSPSQLIDIASSGTDTSAPTVRITNTANNNASNWNGKVSHALEFYSSDTSRVGLASSIKNVAGTDKGGVLTGNITFNTANWPSDAIPQERMRITDDGNVGIGTVSPAYKLQVAGTPGSAPLLSLKNSSNSTGQDVIMSFNRDNSDAIGYSIGIDSADNSFKIAEDGNSINSDPRITILNDGNVGIGTTSPSYKLEVDGTFLASGNSTIQGRTSLQKDLTIRGNDALANQGVARFYVDSSNNLYIDTANDGANLFTIKGTNGNVGIGTTSPSTLLDLDTSIDTAGGINLGYVNSVDRSLRLFFTNNTGGNAIYKDGASLKFTTEAAVGSSSGVTKMTLLDSGNVGIGTTSPQEKLDISAGNIRLDNNRELTWATTDANVGRVRITGNESTDSISFATDNSVRMALTNTGLGIGTTSPVSKLEVDGGDIEVDDSASGLILRSPDGTRYRITVANGGTLTVTAV